VALILHFFPKKCFLLSFLNHRAFFPLNTPALESFPLLEYKGVNDGATITPDPVFGGALRCTASDSDIVALDPVRYGATTGAFTVNLWVRIGSDLTSPSPMYLYSHRGTDADQDQSGWGPNQVQLYFPQKAHPAYGVARLYVRDSLDVDMGNVSTGYIDSDGKIADNTGPRDGPFPLLDGGWHMLSVTSQPQGGAGYRLYHDGQLVADLNGKTVPVVKNDDGITSSTGELMHVDGGDKMVLDGNIILCSRGDDPSQRHIDADIAYLSMWDVALNDTQLEALYNVVNQQMEKVGPLPARGAESSTSSGAPGTEAVSTKRAEVQRMSVTGRPCLFPTVYEGKIVVDCITSGDASRPMDEICPVADGEWEACEPLASRATPTGGSSTYSDPQSFSETPSEYLYPNETAYDVASGGGDESDSPTDSTTEQDYARGTVYSDDGSVCQFPLQYGDIEVNNCLSFGGEQFCWTENLSSSGGRSSPIYGGGETSSNIPAGEWAPCAADALLQPPEPGVLGVGPSTVPVLQLQKVTRVTTDGEICNFPVVVDGQIFDDCIQLADSNDGEPSCMASTSGQWKTCNLKNASPLYISSSTITGGSVSSSGVGTGGNISSSNRPVYVAERTTVTGKNCIFPAAAGKYVWFDCALVGSAGGSQEGDVSSGSGDQRVCSTADATWELCAPANTSAFTTKALE
jgi:hypothetical protein